MFSPSGPSYQPSEEKTKVNADRSIIRAGEWLEFEGGS